MIKTGDWTIDELKILLAVCRRPPAQLVDRIPDRVSTAIGTVQQGVHALHRGRVVQGLSKKTVDYIETQRGSIVCPVCCRVGELKLASMYSAWQERPSGATLIGR